MTFRDSKSIKMPSKERVDLQPVASARMKTYTKKLAPLRLRNWRGRADGFRMALSVRCGAYEFAEDIRLSVRREFMEFCYLPGKRNSSRSGFFLWKREAANWSRTFRLPLKGSRPTRHPISIEG